MHENNQGPCRSRRDQLLKAFELRIPKFAEATPQETRFRRIGIDDDKLDPGALVNYTKREIPVPKPAPPETLLKDRIKRELSAGKKVLYERILV